MHYIDFRINDENHNQIIKEIRTGSNPELIVIIAGTNVLYENDSDNIFIWDVKNDVEHESYDITGIYEVIFDSDGNPYIVKGKEVIFPKERCTIKAFDFQKIEELASSNSKRDLRNQKGHRFDSKNHNWFIFREYISLPFSYMSFVIKHKIEIGDELQKGNQFDIEPYNYLFNKSTSFIDGDFVYLDYLQLSYVL